MTAAPDTVSALRSVFLVGTGLIGASLGTALRLCGVPVTLTDADPAHAALAQELGAGTVGTPAEDPGLVVLAIPPAAVPSELARLQARYPTSVFTDVSSAQVRVRADARRLGCDLGRFVSGHPMAGREFSGPGRADAGLFSGRTWILIDEPETRPESLRLVAGMVALIGGRPTLRTAAAHDRAVALISHAPQLVASALAARMADAAQEDLDLAGPAARDTTRVAASPPELWIDILTSNAAEVATVLDELLGDLGAARDALRQVPPASAPVIADLLRRGQIGRSRLPEPGRFQRPRKVEGPPPPA